DVVLAKVERDGRYRLVANDRLWKPTFELLWDPVVSPDGKHVLVRGVVDEKYFRQVVSLGEIMG
ncbi:MAG TPA: hypothetical protein PL065_20975, partial [Polyangiaceae bacterium]|nr:hypothetical protein [Polyangiaceae bacterium]